MPKRLSKLCKIALYGGYPEGTAARIAETVLDDERAELLEKNVIGIEPN